MSLRELRAGTPGFGAQIWEGEWSCKGEVVGSAGQDSWVHFLGVAPVIIIIIVIITNFCH